MCVYSLNRNHCPRQGGLGVTADVIYGAAAISDGSFVVVGDTFGSLAGLNAGTSDIVVMNIDADGNSLGAWQVGDDMMDIFS